MRFLDTPSLRSLSRLALFASALLLCAGCVTSAEVTSNKDESYSKQLGEVLLVTQFEEDFEEFSTSFTEDFRRALTLRGVQVQSRARTGLELDPKPLDELAAAHDVDLVMSVGQQGSDTETRSGSVPVAHSGGMPMTMHSSTEHAQFEANIFIVSEDRRIWRAQIDTERDGFYGTRSGAGRKMAEKLVAKLAEDGLVAAAPEETEGAGEKEPGAK